MKSKTRAAVSTVFPLTTVIGELGGDDRRLEEAVDTYGHLPARTGLVASNASSITYDVGNKFNFCEHEYDELMVSASADAPYSRCWYSPNEDTFRTSCWKGIHEPEYPVDPIVLDVTESMRKRAWDAFYPDINNGLQLAVSIYEFRDFSRMLKTAKTLKKAFSGLRKAKLPANLGKLLSDSFLSYSFGVKPMLSDLEGLARDVLDMRATVNKFINNGKKAQPYHYREELVNQTTHVLHGNGEITRRSIVEYFATIKLSYEYEVPPNWEVLLRIGGLRVTPSTVWNAIPWTFVVDWLISITDFLEQFDRDPHVVVKVHDYCDTIKCVSESSHHRKVDVPAGIGLQYIFPPWIPDGTDPTFYNIFNGASKNADPLWTWKRVYYKRVPGLPNSGYAFPVLDSLSNRQLVLAGALLHSRM